MKLPNKLYDDLTLSMFPENVDNFLTYVNITASDGPKIKQYLDAMNAGNQTLANEIFETIPNGTQKIIKATDLNKLTQAIQAVERFYKTDVEPYIQKRQNEWTALINQFSYQGVWSPSKSYVVNNMVLYTVNGMDLIYIATSNPPVGSSPTNTNYWRVLTAQGVQGNPGVGTSYRGKWDSIVQYTKDNSVTHDGVLWLSLKENMGVVPGTNNQTWKKVVSITSSYPIQANEPTGQAVGELWFNTSDNPTKYHYLKPLNNPALSANIEAGFQVYDENGNIVTGTMQKLAMTGLEVTAPPPEAILLNG